MEKNTRTFIAKYINNNKRKGKNEKLKFTKGIGLYECKRQI